MMSSYIGRGRPSPERWPMTGVVIAAHPAQEGRTRATALAARARASKVCEGLQAYRRAASGQLSGRGIITSLSRFETWQA